MNNVPSEEEWGEYWKDLDQKSAFKNFFGKSNEQMQALFYQNGNEIMTEIRFMPPKPFSYYILGFRDFILKGRFRGNEASDYASYFLDMVEYLLINNRQLIAPSIEEILPALEYVAQNQEKYKASQDIYGDFLEQLSKIKRISGVNE